MPRKFGKSRQNQTDSPPLLFTMGELDLIFRIDFKEEDLEKDESESKNNDKEKEKDKESKEEEKSNYYKLEDINTLKDLSFIKDNEDLWDRIKLKPGNDNIKLFLIGNKNTKKKLILNIYVSDVRNLKKRKNFLMKFLTTLLIKTVY